MKKDLIVERMQLIYSRSQLKKIAGRVNVINQAINVKVIYS